MTFPSPFYRWRPHPWHGLEAGPNPPSEIHAYIEITPFDLVKYEVDKATGYLRVDRPQRSSSQPPALYGFIPRTYCDDGDPRAPLLQFLGDSQADARGRTGHDRAFSLERHGHSFLSAKTGFVYPDRNLHAALQ